MFCLIACLHHVHAWRVSFEERRGCWSHRTGVTDGYETSCGCWGSNRSFARVVSALNHWCPNNPFFLFSFFPFLFFIQFTSQSLTYFCPSYPFTLREWQTCEHSHTLAQQFSAELGASSPTKARKSSPTRRTYPIYRQQL